MSSNSIRKPLADTLASGGDSAGDPSRRLARASAQRSGLSGTTAPSILGDDEMDRMFAQFKTPPAGQARIRTIRESLPERVTRSTKFSGKLRFPSKKMGFALEAEAFSTEYIALVEWEHDKETLEIYSQPDRLVIEYIGLNGRRAKVHITPDAFRVTRAGFIFTECKTESDLEKLAKKMPNRYVRESEGHWRSPPAEAAASALGCAFEIRSSSQNNFALHENLEILRDFYSSMPRPTHEARLMFEQLVTGRHSISAHELIHAEPGVGADDLYAMLVRDEVYFPLLDLRLADQMQAHFFRSETDWHAYRLMLGADRPDRRAKSHRTEVKTGDTFTWNGVPHTVLNVGAGRVVAQTGGKQSGLIHLATDQLNQLQASGDLEFHAEAESLDLTEMDALLGKAKPADKQKAAWRYEILFGVPGADNPLTDRKPRMRFVWLRQFREAATRWGHGFVGLLPQRGGNRKPKVSPTTKQLAVDVIEAEWESTKRKSASSSHGTYINKAREAGLDPISYRSFCRIINARSGHAQQVTRVGEKAAYDLEPHYLTLERTTPRHGTHSWHIGHIDHTPLPLKLVFGDGFELADTLWLTVLFDAFDRKVRGWYLSFDEPSYRSCMMVIRDCVRRHGRLFQRVVSDGGSDFKSGNYEALLAFYEVTKRERPKGKPKNGAELERWFGTSQAQFVKTLMGSTDIVERHFRAISPEVDPKQHAVWALDTFDVVFERYVDEVYHKAHHSGIEMSPNAAEALSLKSHGERPFRRIKHDSEQFIAQTCPAVQRKTVLVRPEGVKINYLWFDGPVLRQSGLLRTHISATYDPWNCGLAYVFVRGLWHTVHSQHYALFRNLTARQIQFVTAAMRLQARKRGKKAELNAVNLARFVASIEGQEVIARQRRNDAEAQVHRAKNAPSSGRAVVPSGALKPTAEVIQMPVRPAAAEGTAPNRIIRILEDL